MPSTNESPARLSVSPGDQMARRSGTGRRELRTSVEMGAELRSARERTGVSLAEVHERTGISWRELESLEAGDLSRMFDRQRSLAGLQRYAAYLGLDDSPLVGVVEGHWLQTAGGGPQRSSFDDTAAIPAFGASTVWSGTLGPRQRRARKTRRSAPLPLRIAVWLVALLVMVGVAALAAVHGPARWVTGIHWGPASAQASAATQGASGTVASSGGKATVALASPGPRTADVRVQTNEFSVVVVPSASCWVQATASSGSVPVFARVVQAGDRTILNAVDGHLVVELGAGQVTVQVQVGGHTVPGWSFTPSAAPFTLTFSSVIYS